MRQQLCLEAFRVAIAAQLGMDVSQVQGQLRLAEDLGVDSLAMHALLIDLEESGGIIPPPGVLEAVSTVADLHAAVAGAAVS